MELSVIIPCYNEVNTIEKVLNAVKSSSYKPYEIIVVDDYSTDGSRDILRKVMKEDHLIKVLFQTDYFLLWMKKKFYH